ncbi:MAG: SRPBCC family protein [Flammeovirgaceae bacterium]|nr:SRPBCC family protein [Flammeovirgaceae bacterium]
MPRIFLEITIHAEIQVVFDLSRSIDLHKISTAQTKEEAIAGKTKGLLELGESVTWRARHFGITQTLTSKLTEFNYPEYFVDEMITGAFTSFKHEHFFQKQGGKVQMTDIFDYTSPLGLLGKLGDVLFLKKYMENLLVARNKVIKEFAETDKWKKVLLKRS